MTSRGNDPGRQAAIDAFVGSLVDGLEPQDAAGALALLVNRAAVRLHTLTRTQAAARKAQPEWPAWAGLENACRTLVLHSSTCRDLAARLGGPRKPE